VSYCGAGLGTGESEGSGIGAGDAAGFLLGLAAGNDDGAGEGPGLSIGCCEVERARIFVGTSVGTVVGAVDKIGMRLRQGGVVG
jgi:hypothetical protein